MKKVIVHRVWLNRDNSGNISKLQLAVFMAIFSLLGLVVYLSSAANLSISLQTIVSGLTSPVDIANTGVAGDTRLFVVQQTGQIRIINNYNSVSTTPFLDIDSIVLTDSNEQGLLGLAFHPNYTSNGYFFVVYDNNNGDLELSRFTRSSTNSNLADTASRKLILTVPHPTNTNHNGGDLNFGSDGYLYWSIGDGGSGGDPPNNAQNKDVLLGKILRLDINSSGAYNIPPSNPLVGVAGRDEIWAYGLRNPWRFSFDRQNGDMYIGDVGQNLIEEIDYQPASAAGGRNYGWRCYEGLQAYNISGCGAQSSYISPVATYDHSNSRCSITGGYIYRGPTYPSMQGYYLFADYCSGHLYSLRNNSGTWTQELQGQFSANISSFGEDIKGDLFATDVSRGLIYRIVTPSGSSDTTIPTVTLTAPASGATISGNAVISANATDNVGVTKVEFLVDSTIVNTDTTSPYSYNWNSAGTTNGSHNVKAKAYDAAGNSQTSTAITVTVSNTSSLPSPWQDRDIGSVGLAGTAAYASGTFSVNAAGGEIFNAADAFHFVYQPLNGDGQITARIVSFENTDPNAKIGLMIRETLLADSKNINLIIKPTGEEGVRQRTTTGGTTASPTNSTGTVPSWMRINRVGNSFTVSMSSDGSTWTHLTTQTITMNTGVYIGLALTSSNNNIINHSTFDNVQVGFGIPAVEIQTPGHSDTISGTYVVTATATDDTGVTKMEFWVDNVLKSTDATAPYSYNWDTTSYTNGTHTISALAYDASGNVGSHTHITTIQNVQSTSCDLNGDSTVNIYDLSIMLNNFGTSGSNVKGDCNTDGKVDVSDISILLSKFHI